MRSAPAGCALHGAVPPPYSAVMGDAVRGAQVFETFCAGCHGPGGRGGPKASAITEAAYLSLISNQGLRTTVIVGRPELGAPDWRGNVPGRPMTAADHVKTISYGKEKPFCTESNEQCWQQNRRGHFVYQK